MTENIKPQPGTICWNELNASDLEAAKKFYTEVMGWTCQEIPDQKYTLFLQEGEPIAGLMDTAFIENGDQIPPNWFVYLTVANMDEALAKVISNGGAVMKEPFHVADTGVIAIIVDAAKAVLGLIEPE